MSKRHGSCRRSKFSVFIYELWDAASMDEQATDERDTAKKRRRFIARYV